MSDLLLDLPPCAVPVIETDGLDRDDWLEARRMGIGGSDAAAICGLDRYRSPFEVWLEKVGAPEAPEDLDSEAAEWGRRLEDVVADAVAEREGVQLERLTWLMSHIDRPWMLANVDRIVHDPMRGVGVYEGKTAGHFVGAEWADNAVPGGYTLQGLHYCDVLGLDYVLFGVLIGGQKLEVRTVERDQELIDHLISIEAEFWRRVEEREPPAPDGSKACTDLLAHLYDVKAGDIAYLQRGDVMDLLVRRDEAKALVKQHERDADECENRLKVLLGDREIAADEDGRTLFTWKQHERTALDQSRLKAERPELVAEFSKTSTYRQFRVPAGVLAGGEG